MQVPVQCDEHYTIMIYNIYSLEIYNIFMTYFDAVLVAISCDYMYEYY